MATPSIERNERSRLLPRLSLRNVLVLLTLGVLLAWLARMAYAGDRLAVTLLLTFGSFLLFKLISTILFVMAWLPAVIVRSKVDDRLQGNPFAADQLPPQILPPKTNS